MSEKIQNDLTKRQLYAFHYLLKNEMPSLNTDLERYGNNYKYQLIGKAKESPEIENLDFDERGNGAVVVFHGLSNFLITDNKSQKQLDLVKITPDGWSQKSIELTSPAYISPEVYEVYGHYQPIKVDEYECIISNGVGLDNPENVDIAVRMGLWNTLTARFISEIGNPVNDEGIKGMRDSILQRRQEVLNALGKKDESSPQEIALKSFKLE